MPTLKNLILSLDDECYQEFLIQTEGSKGVKYGVLLKSVRNNVNKSDEELAILLEVNASAYYALKSRLFEKLRQFITAKSKKSNDTFTGSSDEILALTIDNDRSTAIIILENLEKNYLVNDQHLELLAVYAAFKRFYLNTDKHYHYSQRYNQHLSIFIALNKSEELLGNFATLLNKYLLSGDCTITEILKVIIKELKHIASVHNVITLRFYFKIASSLYSMKVDRSIENLFDDEGIEESFEFFEVSDESQTAFERRNKYILSSLKFEYYYLTKQYKKCVAIGGNQFDYLKEINIYQYFIPAQSNLLQIYHLFVMQKINAEQLPEFEIGINKFSENTRDVQSLLFADTCKALIFYNKKEYIKCIKTLTDIINNYSLKDYCLAEVELKYLLCFSLVKANKFDLIENYLKSTNRKKKQLTEDNLYLDIAEKIVKLNIKSKDVVKQQKLVQDLKKSFVSSKPLFLHLVNLEDN